MDRGREDVLEIHLCAGLAKADAVRDVAAAKKACVGLEGLCGGVTFDPAARLRPLC
jgi:hypothetical protein